MTISQRIQAIADTTATAAIDAAATVPLADARRDLLRRRVIRASRPSPRLRLGA